MQKKLESKNAHPTAERQLTIPQEKNQKVKRREVKRGEKPEGHPSMTLPYNSPSEESLGIITTSSPNSGRKLAQYS
jgi:hypothetical protein